MSSPPARESVGSAVKNGSRMQKADSIALLLALMTIIGMIIFNVFYQQDSYRTYVMFYGACVGFGCGAYVILRLRLDRRFHTPMMRLTFYHVLAQFGLSVRFMFSPYVNERLCGHFECDLNNLDNIDEEDSIDEEECAPWSAMLHFFLVASELWFLCIAIDFAVSLSNPFSPFKDRMRRYQLFVWGTAFVSAMVVAGDSNIYGLWYPTSDRNLSSICWIKVNSDDKEGNQINTNAWILFYIPLVLIFAYAVYVTFCAYSILSHGIQVSFAHRAKVLFFSQLLLITYTTYYIFLLAIYLCVLLIGASNLWLWMIFFIPARGILGVFTLYCFQYRNFLVDENSDKRSKDSEDSVVFDLNSALQNEIVAYATVGIQESALLTHKESSMTSDHVIGKSETQNQFWINIPEELVQFKSLQGIVDVVDRDFKERLKALTESRSIAKLKSLFYQEPKNLQLDERGSERSSAASGSSPSTSRLSFRASEVAAGSTGLSLQKLIPSEMEERYSTTNPNKKSEEVYCKCLGHLIYFIKNLRVWLKSNSIILNSTPSPVHFTEYSPTTFYEIRRYFGMEKIYAECFDKPIKLHNAEGGASNALFFFSECRKFMAKSCTAEEMKHVRKHAEKLRNHFHDNRKSLITKIFGAYKLQVYSSDLYFIVTNNVLMTDPAESITEKYDLKGSSVNRYMKAPRDGETVRCRVCGNAFVYNSKSHFRRECLSVDKKSTSDDDAKSDSVESDVESVGSGSRPNSRPFSPSVYESSKSYYSRRVIRRRLSSMEDKKNLPSGELSGICPLFRHVPDAVLKDNDLRGKAKIRLPEQAGDDLIMQLHIDCEFLCSVYGVMDYSLLVGVFKTIHPSDSLPGPDLLGNSGLSSRWKAGEFVVDYSYYMGIIDYQQPYTWRKKMETWYKTFVLRYPREEISCIPPNEYKDRLKVYKLYGRFNFLRMQVQHNLCSSKLQQTFFCILFIFILLSLYCKSKFQCTVTICL